jgi:hypothetical protein
MNIWAGVAKSGLAQATEKCAGLKILWSSTFVSPNLTPRTSSTALHSHRNKYLMFLTYIALLLYSLFNQAK